MIISTMTILELSTALGIVIAGVAGLLKASACKRIECGLVKGCICVRELLPEPDEDITPPPAPKITRPVKKDDFSKALETKI